MHAPTCWHPADTHIYYKLVSDIYNGCESFWFLRLIVIRNQEVQSVPASHEKRPHVQPPFPEKPSYFYEPLNESGEVTGLVEPSGLWK